MHLRLPLSYAIACLQALWIRQVQAFAVRGDSVLRVRDTTSDLVHDSFFIPGVVSSGVVFLIAILCVLMIFLTSSRPDRPLPLTPHHDNNQEIRPLSEVQHNTSPRPRSYLSRTNTGITNASGSGSFYYNRPPSQNIQRKPAPVYQPSPNRTPPGTATLANFSPAPGTSNVGSVGPSSYVHQLRPGVPQHPNLAKYNPEPLIYTPAPPPSTEFRDPSPKLMAYQWTHPQVQAPPHDPRLHTAQPVPGSSSSMTRVGSGRSEQATDQETSGYGQVAPQNPAPSPPSAPPHSQTDQKADQRQSHLTTMKEESGFSAGSHEASTDHRNAYGGIEAEEMGIRTHPSSREGHAQGQTRILDQPPDYGSSNPSQKVYPVDKVPLQGG